MILAYCNQKGGVGKSTTVYHHARAAILNGQRVLVIDAESTPGPVGCPECGVVAESAGRKVLVLTDAPMGGTPVRVRWRKRRWRCRQDGCGVRSFTEQNPAVTAANKAALRTFGGGEARRVGFGG